MKIDRVIWGRASFGMNYKSTGIIMGGGCTFRASSWLGGYLC